MIKLTDADLQNLSYSERYDYYDNLNKYNWSQKTLAHKDREILDTYELYIGHRDIGSDTLEEKINIILNSNSQSLNYLEVYGIEFSDRIAKHQKRVINGEKFTFFWDTKSPFSQWYKAKFNASTLLVEGINDMYEVKRKDLLNGLFPYDVQEYSSAEQFMMYHKAMIFLDRETANKIMKTNNVRLIKELGRNVKNYNDDVWKFYRSKIVYEGNLAKFNQNKAIKDILFKTEGTTLVEAAPNDILWGVGLAQTDPKINNRNTWEGKNLLGEILTQLRIDFMGTY